MILDWIEEARRAGARLRRACEVVGLDTRTVQRWLERGTDGGDDRRRGPNTRPGNALSEAERAQVLSQVVPVHKKHLLEANTRALMLGREQAARCADAAEKMSWHPQRAV